ncbi:diguanylate cyclase [Shigella sonnei]|nr:diguanylate cyclase [Shigella sonnei]QBJ58162.1 diguanylate cyclase [Shigella sonnei]QBQ27508.1 diguanylate cyclase [Shigella sonnei]
MPFYFRKECPLNSGYLSMTSIFITMMLIWLLLSVTSVLTLKQYAQKNLALTAATIVSASDIRR